MLIYACLLLKARYSLFIFFIFSISDQILSFLLTICFGSLYGKEQSSFLIPLFLGIKELSIKFLFLMEPEVHCSDNVTHLGQVCEVLLLPTNAATLLKGIKVKDPQHL